MRPNFGLLSSGERIAVALVLDRHDPLQRAWKQNSRGR
jgi:hypothetical protein